MPWLAPPWSASAPLPVAPFNGYSCHPLTLSLTDAAADVLMEYARRTQRWQLVAQYDTEAHRGRQSYPWSSRPIDGG